MAQAVKKKSTPVKTTLELEPNQIIIKPLVTEKGMHRATRCNAYAFQINRLANKTDVKHAVQELFDVRVLKVNIQNRKGKPRRTKMAFGYTNSWKKAIVTLDPEHRIELF